MVVAPWFCKCESAQVPEVAMMDTDEAVNKPGVGAMADAMSALLVLMVKQKILVSSPTLRTVTVAVIMAEVLDEVPMAALMNDS